MIDVTESVKTFINYFELNMPVNVEVDHTIEGGDELILTITCIYRGNLVSQSVSCAKIHKSLTPDKLAAVHASAFRTKLLDMETRPDEDDEDDDD